MVTSTRTAADAGVVSVVEVETAEVNVGVIAVAEADTAAVPGTEFGKWAVLYFQVRAA